MVNSSMSTAFPAEKDLNMKGLPGAGTKTQGRNTGLGCRALILCQAILPDGGTGFAPSLSLQEQQDWTLALP